MSFLRSWFSSGLVVLVFTSIGLGCGPRDTEPGLLIHESTFKLIELLGEDSAFALVFHPDEWEKYGKNLDSILNAFLQEKKELEHLMLKQ